MRILVLITNLILWTKPNRLTGRQFNFKECGLRFPCFLSFLLDDWCLPNRNSHSHVFYNCTNFSLQALGTRRLSIVTFSIKCVTIRSFWMLRCPIHKMTTPRTGRLGVSFQACVRYIFVAAFRDILGPKRKVFWTGRGVKLTAESSSTEVSDVCAEIPSSKPGWETLSYVTH
jgi:hypothetical protein